MSRFRILTLVAATLSATLWAYACGDGTAEPPTPDPPQPTTVTISPAAAQLTALDATVQLTAEVRDQHGQAMAGANVSWASGNAAVATVGSAGLVTATGNGTATITASAGAASGTAEVVVAQAVSSVDVTPPVDTLVPGETLSLAAEARDANGHAVAGQDFSWASRDTLIAVVSADGVVTAVGTGEVEVTATTAGVTGHAALTVVLPAPTTVGVTPDTVVLSALGQTAQLVPEVRDQIGRVMDDLPVSWSSADTTIALVDSAGLVAAVGAGTTTITARAGEVSGTATAIVMQSAGSVIVSPRADTIEPGDTLRMVAQAFDENGHVIERAEFSWSSSEKSVVQVDGSGLVRGVGEGTATVSAASGTARGVSNITVVNPDRAALEAFYRATDGENWISSDGWLTDLPLGQWHGVTTASDGRVIGLLMNLNDVTGPIPPELGNLSRLESLVVYNTTVRTRGLTGSIPAELGRLSRLRALVFGSSSLTGPIPPELGSLSKLEDLALHYNRLVGSIPGELGDLESLQHLQLHGNRLSGAIPPELGNLSQLRSMWLFSNDLSGPIPASLGNLSRLEGLGLSENALTGPIPAELGRLSNVRRLWLHENQLESIPPEFGRLSELTALWVYDNKLAGSIPAELGNLAAATDFLLFNNDLSGPLPPELGNLRSVERMWLSGNRLEGSVPGEFGRIESLRELDLTNNAGMSGTLPNGLTALKELRAFLAGGTDLCAPRDSDFLAWLDGVFKRRVKLCEAEAASVAYLAQTMQSREFPVPLVAGEEALLRVFVTAQAAGGAGIPPVRASFYLNGAEAHVVEIAAQSTPIPSAVDEGDLDVSANARVPGDVIQPGLEMVIEIDPDGTLDPSVKVTRRIPEEGRTPVHVEGMPTLALTLVPFLWTTNPDSAILDMTMDMAADPENHELLKHTRTLLPVGGLDVQAHDPVLSSTNSGFDLHARIKAIRVMEGGSGHYMGLMSGRTTGAASASTPGWTSFSWPHSSTMAHELGHNMSLGHAPGCGAGGPDPAFPNTDGTIGVWGYEFDDEIRLVPPSTDDLMTYCSPRWIGEYHFTNALRYRLSEEGAAASSTTARSTTILLWGGIDDRGRPFLEPAFLLDSPPSMPGFGTEYEIVGRTADGDEMFSFRFDMPNDADADGRASFAFALPAESRWAGNLVSVTLSGPGGSATLDTDTDRPMGILLDRLTGLVRGFLHDPPAALADTAAALQPGLDVMFSRGIPER